VYHLRGAAELETTDVHLQASEIHYDDATGEAVAKGAVKYRNLLSGERLEAERVEYNLREQTGRFYEVKGRLRPKSTLDRGCSSAKIRLSFWQGQSGSKTAHLHDAFLTNCRLPAHLTLTVHDLTSFLTTGPSSPSPDSVRTSRFYTYRPSPLEEQPRKAASPRRMWAAREEGHGRRWLLLGGQPQLRPDVPHPALHERGPPTM
jgi:hypothetical protein